jgi:hypothetical protein
MKFTSLSSWYLGLRQTDLIPFTISYKEALEKRQAFDEMQEQKRMLEDAMGTAS